MYADTDFPTLRERSECNADEMLLKAADHDRAGLYNLVSLNASKRSFVVYCICEKNTDGLPERWYTD